MTEQPHEAPLPPAPKLPFEVKANFMEYRRRLGVFRIVLALALSLIIWLRFGLTAWLISVAIIVVTIFLVLWLLHRRTLTATAEGITFKNSFSRRRTLTWDRVGDVYVFANYVEAGFGISPRVIITNTDGRGFVSLTSLYWHIDEINLLLALFKERNIDAKWFPNPVQSMEIAKAFPKIVPGYERHPFLLAWAIVGLIIVAVTAFVLLTR